MMHSATPQRSPAQSIALRTGGPGKLGDARHTYPSGKHTLPLRTCISRPRGHAYPSIAARSMDRPSTMGVTPYTSIVCISVPSRPAPIALLIVYACIVLSFDVHYYTWRLLHFGQHMGE